METFIFFIRGSDNKNKEARKQNKSFLHWGELVLNQDCPWDNVHQSKYE